MSGYLLDTNVVSETMHRVPDLQVVTFLTEHDDLWLSTIVLHKLELGDALMAGTAKANGLCVATRNVTDLHHINIDVTNLWVAS